MFGALIIFRSPMKVDVSQIVSVLNSAFSNLQRFSERIVRIHFHDDGFSGVFQSGVHYHLVIILKVDWIGFDFAGESDVDGRLLAAHAA